MDMVTLREVHHLPLLSIVQWCPIEEDNREVTLHRPHHHLLTDK
jgi:hypothetical protein